MGRARRSRAAGAADLAGRRHPASCWCSLAGRRSSRSPYAPAQRRRLAPAVEAEPGTRRRGTPDPPAPAGSPGARAAPRSPTPRPGSSALRLRRHAAARRRRRGRRLAERGGPGRGRRGGPALLAGGRRHRAGARLLADRLRLHPLRHLGPPRLPRRLRPAHHRHPVGRRHLLAARRPPLRAALLRGARRARPDLADGHLDRAHRRPAGHLRALPGQRAGRRRRLATARRAPAAGSRCSRTAHRWSGCTAAGSPPTSAPRPLSDLHRRGATAGATCGAPPTRSAARSGSTGDGRPAPWTAGRCKDPLAYGRTRATRCPRRSWATPTTRPTRSSPRSAPRCSTGCRPALRAARRRREGAASRPGGARRPGRDQGSSGRSSG